MRDHKVLAHLWRFRFYAIVAGCLLCAWLYRSQLQEVLDRFGGEALQDLYRTGAQVFGALLGFVVAALAILLAVGESPSMRRLYRSGRSEDVFSAFSDAAGWLAGAALLCVIGLIYGRHSSPILWWNALVASTSAVATYLVGYSIWVLVNIVAIVMTDREDQERALKVPDRPDPTDPLD